MQFNALTNVKQKKTIWSIKLISPHDQQQQQKASNPYYN